ncbi:molybdopterin-guanine dinucleotide biosynthesis protein B [Metabacillus arenae]|uniref:Molybdopterin-guanine dinucleotide biosynthesis protein B n=1 Tax=Metabacillus arenae TaxID=2771434 RepID=A0A926NI60_9BACI|nr:molybdopterin-guanine dinucleotide biosynthesis protein B [Metabacillus arenae]MBD1381776.1 molybdopterin-guanine dinucleotide biosynthesis protein B [Metabacillus arenae]
MALGEHCSILQIVGFQNSGKTTLMEKLIARAAKEGLKVATIKHHGHGGTPVNELTSKDSLRHQQAGAAITGVEGDGVLQICAKRNNWQLDEIIKFYQSFAVDIILIEGYKQENYQKAVLIRNKCDLSLLDSLTNIVCVNCWREVPTEKITERQYPIFHLDEDKKIIDFLISKVREQRGKNTI